MFAHQVIEDIDWFLGKVNMLKKREEFLYWIKENIQMGVDQVKLPTSKGKDNQ